MHSHYDTLGVRPSADDAVLRASYRALMRLYHPDVNKDAEALSRAREITAAYAVVGNRQRRAAYDALLATDRFAPPHRARSGAYQVPTNPVWRALAASLSLAAVISVAIGSWVAVWPELQLPPPAQYGHPTGTAHAKRTHQATQAALIPAPTNLQHVAAVTRPVIPDLVFAKDPSVTDEIIAVSNAAGRAQLAQAATQKMLATPVVKNAPTPKPVPAQAAAGNCLAGAESDGRCLNKEQARAEHDATSLFTQSIAHADLQKQQLLLSARNRSAAARAMCQSGDCVRDAYLQQFRETVTIMEGGIPRP